MLLYTIVQIWDLINQTLRYLEKEQLNEIFSFPGCILCAVRDDSILHDEPTGRGFPVLDVPGNLSPDILRGSVGGSGRGSSHERPKWRIFGPSHVRAFPPVLRILRQLRRHTGLPQMDHLPQLHPVRLRGHGAGHLLLRPTEAQVLERKSTFIIFYNFDESVYLSLYINCFFFSVGILPL